MTRKIGFKTTFDEVLVREVKISATIGEIDVNDILEPCIEFYLNQNTDLRERILYKLLTKKARNNTLQYDICKKVVKLDDTDFRVKLKVLQDKGLISFDGQYISITDKGRNPEMWDK